MKNYFVIILLLLSTTILASNKYSKYSITLESGFSLFDGDIKQSLTSAIPQSNCNLLNGISINYKMTQLYTLSLSYNYTYLSDIGTRTNLLYVDNTVDLTHLVSPEYQSKWYVNGSLGFGVSHYVYDKSTIPNLYGNAIILPMSLGVNYNLGLIDIGSKISYVIFNKDNLEGTHEFKGIANDRLETFKIYLTYKFKYNEKISKLNLWAGM